MLRKWRTAGLACIATIVTSAGSAQAQAPAAAAPAAPAGGATAVASGPGATAVASAEAKPGFFKKLCDTLEECKRKICKTPAGAMLNNLTKPLTAATGGIIPGFCPAFPSEKDLAQPGAAGAAAAGKKDAMEAGARRDAVRYLGTLDCRYFPDAAKALAAALRTDSSECVRYEAALVLNRGCCCTQLTIDALEASVSGMEVDGNPAERSGRVRCAAATALEKCLSCYVQPAKEPVDVEIEKKETKPGEATPGTVPAPMPATVKMSPGSRMPSPESVERARKTLEKFNEMVAFHKAPSNTGIVQAKATMALPAGQQTLFHILRATAEEQGEPLKAPASQTAVARAPVVEAPATTVVETPSVKPAQAITEVPAMMPAPVTTPKPVTVLAPVTTKAPVAMPAVKVEEPVVAPVMIMPPALDTEPKALPTEKKIEIKTPEVKVPEVKLPEIKTPVAKAPEASKEPAGQVIAIIPAKAVEAPKTTPTTVPGDKASEAVIELAKKVTQNPSVAERHAAIRQIVKFDWKKHPMVASALMTGAANDKEPAVRVDCMRHMVAYKVTHPQVITELQALSNDPDVWVRQEAVQTLSLLNAMK